MKNIIITITSTILIVIALIFATKSGILGDKAGTGSVSNTVAESLDLEIPERFFDFGTISMSKGDVEHIFKIKNTGASPVNLEKLYTSCMCTIAYLKIGEYDRGPFGMPGHS